MSSRRLTRRGAVLDAVGAALIPGSALAQSSNISNRQEPTELKIRMTFGDQTLTATLHDNPSAHDFYLMLPLDLAIEDFGHNEKIAQLPRKLTEAGNGPFDNEQPGDLCYYMPWGNLAMFYAPYQHPGLIRHGRFDDFGPLLTRGEFSLHIERLQ